MQKLVFYFYILLSVGLLSCSSERITQPTEPLHGWVVQAPEYGINEFYAVDFPDPLHGWIVGSSGTILHTNNGGIRWSRQNSNTKNMLYNSYFLSNDIGWAVTLDGNIIHTEDGGNNWELQYAEPNLGLYDIQFTDLNHGWVCGRGKFSDTSGWAGTLLGTTNGGQTWNILLKNETVSQSINGLYFKDSLKGWITGNFIRGTFRTDDGGHTWQPLETLGGSINDLIFFDDSVGISYARTAAVLKTLNAGYSWNYLPVTTNGRWLFGMDFVDKQKGWLCGENGFVTHTFDGGETWENQFTDVGNTLRDIDFTSPTTGWAVGFGGTIIKTNDAGNNWDYINGTQAFLYDMEMFDKTHGCAVGQRGMIMRTNNGGKDWDIISTGILADLNSVETPSYHNWFVVGDSGTVLKSTNQGSSWSEIPIRINSDIKDLFFIDDNNGWVVGGKYIAYTTNGGNNWVVDSLMIENREDISSIYFIDSTGWLTTWSRRIFKSSDNGMTWVESQVEDWISSLYDLHMITKDHGFAVGYNLGLFETKDGGETWEWIYLSDGLNHFYEIHFSDSLNGCIVGETFTLLNGIIYKTTDGGATWNLVTKTVENSLRAVDFIDSRHGWICGNNGTILYTNDGGSEY